MKSDAESGPILGETSRSHFSSSSSAKKRQEMSVNESKEEEIDGIWRRLEMEMFERVRQILHVYQSRRESFTPTSIAKDVGHVVTDERWNRQISSYHLERHWRSVRDRKDATTGEEFIQKWKKGDRFLLDINSKKEEIVLLVSSSSVIISMQHRRDWRDPIDLISVSHCSLFFSYIHCVEEMIFLVEWVSLLLVCRCVLESRGYASKLTWSIDPSDAVWHYSCPSSGLIHWY